MGRRCLPFTFPSNVFNFARPAYCRRNKSKSLSALRDPGLFLFCAPPLAAASWARKKRRIPDAEKVVSFFSCFLRNSPLASHLVPPESLANPHFSHFLPSHPALSRISQLSCLFTSGAGRRWSSPSPGTPRPGGCNPPRGWRPRPETAPRNPGPGSWPAPPAPGHRSAG